MIILGNFYRIREKGDESMPEKDSIIKINKYENKIYYYEIVNGIFYFNKRFKEDSQFLKFCDKVDIESIQQYLPSNHPDLIVKLTSFPLEGCVYDDVNNLESLAKYLMNRPFNPPVNKTVKKDAIGIGWNKTSCWWLKTNKSEKTNYKLSDLESFLPKTEIIPEYVEATSKYDYYIIPGYVYRVIDKTDTKALQLECNLQTGKYNPKTILFAGTHEFSFKESIKEKYEAQNKPKQLTGNDLLPNEIYVTNNPTDYIFKTSETGRGYLCYICRNNSFNFSTNKNFIWTGNLRLATNEEKKWLNTYISQDKFIPEEDLHLYDDLGYLINKCEECNDTGKVMKAKLYPSGHTEVWEDCEKCQKKEIMFKKDDYIVCLNELPTKEGKMNFCYKLVEDQKQLNNEESHLFFDKYRAISIPQHQIRYATSEEIIEFERLGQPFDVNTLIKKVEESLIGLYVKRISYNSYASYEIPKIGEYDIIEKEDDTFYFLKKFKSIEKHLLLNYFELMPVGFKPSNEEWIPKVGDWYILEQYHTSYWFKGKLFQIGSIINGHIHPMVNNKPDLSASFMITGIFKDCRPALPHEIPINSDCIIYNGQDISKGLEVSQYYEFDGNNYSKEIHIPVINKRKIEKQLITIESSPYLELNLKTIKTKQIQTIKI